MTSTTARKGRARRDRDQPAPQGPGLLAWLVLAWMWLLGTASLLTAAFGAVVVYVARSSASLKVGDLGYITGREALVGGLLAGVPCLLAWRVGLASATRPPVTPLTEAQIKNLRQTRNWKD